MEFKRNGTGRKASSDEVVLAIIFIFAVTVPLALIAVFPDSKLLQAINSNGICFLVFVALAVLVSVLVTRFIFRLKKWWH